MTKASVLEKHIEMAQHNIFCYSGNYAMTKPKEGFEKEWQESKEELSLLMEIVELVENRENKKEASAQEALKMHLQMQKRETSANKQRLKELTIPFHVRFLQQ